MSAHAELGASGAKRWMNCPGQPAISRGLPNNSSIHALTGTVAHALAEHLLESKKYHVPEHWYGHPPLAEYPGITVDSDMADAVNVYLTHCRRIIDGLEVGDYWLERKVNMGPLAYGYPNHVAHSMFGTADFTALDFREGVLYVSDYKHGSGVEVQAYDNPQLWYYGLGALLMLTKKERRQLPMVLISVVQPRDDGLAPVRRQMIPAQELMDWGKNTLMPAAELADSLHGWSVEDLNDSGYLVPGDHCKFCPAAGICPAVRAQRLERAKMVFSEEGGRIEPEKPVQDLSVEELRQVLDSADDIISWVKSAQQLAHQMLEQRTVNEVDLGYKLVRKRPQRKWALTSNEDMADTLCEEFGLGDEDLFETKLRSVAQVEKAIGPAKAKRSAKWRELVVSESSGTTLAPESDTREAVKPKSAGEAFGGNDDDESLI